MSVFTGPHQVGMKLLINNRGLLIFLGNWTSTPVLLTVNYKQIIDISKRIVLGISIKPYTLPAIKDNCYTRPSKL